jgi:hypothetical protein
VQEREVCHAERIREGWFRKRYGRFGGRRRRSHGRTCCGRAGWRMRLPGLREPGAPWTGCAVRGDEVPEVRCGDDAGIKKRVKGEE